MKKIILTVWLCLFLLIGGCLFKIEGEYFSSSDHKTTEGIGREGVTQVRDYYSLKNIVTTCIKNAEAYALFNTESYYGDIEEDIKLIETEIMNVFPLGVYAVESVSFTERTMSQSGEMAVDIKYKLTRERINSIKPVRVVADFERQMTEYFGSNSEFVAYSFTNYNMSVTTLEERFMKCWMSAFESALPVRKLEISFYPSDQSRRVVTLSTDYLYNQSSIPTQIAEVRKIAERDCTTAQNMTVEAKLRFIHDYFKGEFELVEMGSIPKLEQTTVADTAYGAIIQRKASQVGVVLGAGAMCRLLDINAEAVVGEKNGKAYAWLRVYKDGEYSVFDVCADRDYLVDSEQEKSIYSYSIDMYPKKK